MQNYSLFLRRLNYDRKLTIPFFYVTFLSGFILLPGLKLHKRWNPDEVGYERSIDLLNSTAKMSHRTTLETLSDFFYWQKGKWPCPSSAALSHQHCLPPPPQHCCFKHPDLMYINSNRSHPPPTNTHTNSFCQVHLLSNMLRIIFLWLF